MSARLSRLTALPTVFQRATPLRAGLANSIGSFGTHSAQGSRFVDSLRTVVATRKQQQRKVLEYLTAACEAALRNEPAPSWLPESQEISAAQIAA